MKNLIFTLLTFVLISEAISQVFQPQWESCFGGTEWDEGTGIIVSDSVYYVLGTTESVDGDISYNHGSVDIWFLSVDSHGNLISEKTLGGSKVDDLGKGIA